MKSLREDVTARQRSTVWPDTLRNGVSVDWYLWHGNPKARLVQRIGAVVFGLAYIVCAFMGGYMGTHFWPAFLPASIFAYAGIRMLRNAFLR
jgi:hypothetical protein